MTFVSLVGGSSPIALPRLMRIAAGHYVGHPPGVLAPLVGAAPLFIYILYTMPASALCLCLCLVTVHPARTAVFAACAALPAFAARTPAPALCVCHCLVAVPPSALVAPPLSR